MTTSKLHNHRGTIELHILFLNIANQIQTSLPNTVATYRDERVIEESRPTFEFSRNNVGRITELTGVMDEVQFRSVGKRERT